MSAKAKLVPAKVWIKKSQWDSLKKEAKRAGTTASELLREILTTVGI